MPVRDFDGSDDSIFVDNGAIGAFNEAGDSHTIVAIVKPALTANPQTAFSIRAGVTSDNMASLYFADDGTTHNGTDDPSGVSYTGSGFVNTSWQIVAVSKGAGTVAARFHRKVLGSGSWSHTDGTGTIGTTTSVASECRIGELANAAGNYDGLIAVIAFYTTVLSDGQIETIQTTPSTQTLLDLGAVGLWEFNQASTALSVVDRTGFGADQTAITGTTVVTGDDPPGWTFAETLANSLHFAGPAHRRAFSPGTLVATGAFSAAAIIKRTGDEGSAYAWFTRFESSPMAFPLGHLDVDQGAIMTWNGSTERAEGPIVDLPYNEWLLMGMSKAAGTVTARYHVYRYSTDQWEHGNFSGGTLANFPAMTEVNWGAAVGGGENLVGNILIGAFWDSEVADATFETLAFEKSAWVTAAPDEAYRFDTTDIIVPFVGTGTQVGYDAETLDVGDAPAGWSEDIFAPVSLGSNSGGSTTLAITTTVGVAAGEKILVAAGCRGGTLTGVVDDRGNSYTIDVQGTTGIGNAAVASATVTTPIIAGDEITATFTAATANFVHARSVSGLGDLDQTDTNGQFNTTAWTSTALTTTEDVELVFGCSMLAGTATASTPTANSEAYDATSSGNTFTAVYRLVHSIGSYAAQGTWGTASGDQHSVVASYKVAEAPGGPPSRTGTASQVNGGAGNGSTSVTVPADATGAVAFWCHWNSNQGGYLNTLTLAGETFFGGYGTQALEGEETDRPGVGVAFLNEIPGTGSQTLAWAWDNPSDARDEGGEIVIVWVKDTNTSDPVRDAGVSAGTGTETIEVGLDTETTDLVLAFCQRFFGGDPALDGATEFIDNASLNNHTYDVGQIDSPGTPTTTVTMTNESFSAMAVISLPAAPGEEAQEATFIIPMRMI